MQKQAEQDALAAGNSLGPNGEMPTQPPATTREKHNGETITDTQSELPVPKAMANRNKKKGFLKEMANIQGKKTVFGTEAQGSSIPLQRPTTPTADSTPAATPNRSVAWTQSRVIPPSELEILPSNVFVTHVEYQRHGWTPRNRNSRQRQTEVVNASSNRVGASAETDGEGNMDEEQLLNDDSVALDNGEQSTTLPTKETLPSDGAEEDIWTNADTRFDSLTAPMTGSTSGLGTVLAWKVR